MHRGYSNLQQLKLENSRRLRAEIERRSVAYTAMPEVVTLNHTDI